MQVYKIPLTSEPHFVRVPVSRVDVLNSVDTIELSDVWSFEGRHHQHDKWWNCTSPKPLPRKLLPFEHVLGLQRKSERRPAETFRQRRCAFKVYVNEGLDYDMPFNATVAALAQGARIRAEFIIVATRMHGKHITDTTHIDRRWMEALAAK